VAAEQGTSAEPKPRATNRTTASELDSGGRSGGRPACNSPPHAWRPSRTRRRRRRLGPTDLGIVRAASIRVFGPTSELRRFPADGSFVAAAEPGAEFVLPSRSRPPSGLRFRWMGRAPLSLATRPSRVFDSRQRRRSAFTHGLTEDQINEC